MMPSYVIRATQFEEEDMDGVSVAGKRS